MKRGVRKERFAVVHPIGHKPFKERPNLSYRDNAELTAQLVTFAKSKWPAPQQIAVDTHAEQILVDGVARAKFSLHEHRATEAHHEALPGVGL